MNLIQIRKTLFAAAMAAAVGSSGIAYAQTSGSSDKSTAAVVGEAITDSAITTKVKAKLIGDNRTKTVKIGVETNDGVVTLTGKARSEKAKANAEKIAAGVTDVKSVVNNIIVGVKTTSVVTKTEDATKSAASETGEAVSDTWITTKVKTSLLTDKQIKDGDVSVETNDGVVTLTGTVPTAVQKSRAITKIRQIKGVKSVVSTDLKVATAS